MGIPLGFVWFCLVDNSRSDSVTSRYPEILGQSRRGILGRESNTDFGPKVNLGHENIMNFGPVYESYFGL